MRVQSEKSKTMTKRPKKEDTKSREKVLNAALNEFIEKGFSGARMQTIADHAGINKAMLHYYYSNKETLYEAALNFQMDEFEKVMKTALADSLTLEDFIGGHIDAFFGYHATHPGFIKLVMWEFIGDMQTMKKKIANEGMENVIPSNVIQSLKKSADLQRENKIRQDIEPLQILMNIMGLLSSAMIQSHVCSLATGSKFEDILDERKQSIKKLLIAGLKPVK